MFAICFPASICLFGIYYNSFVRGFRQGNVIFWDRPDEFITECKLAFGAPVGREFTFLLSEIDTIISFLLLFPVPGVSRKTQRLSLTINLYPSGNCFHFN